MKICFWGNISGALIGKTEGGGELQISFIAKALAECGHEVVVVDYNVKEDFITSDGIKVNTIKGWHKGVRILRTITHRLPALYHALKDQNADIYYCRIRDFRHIIAFWVSRKIKAKFILHMASDLDAMNFGKRLKNYYFRTSAGLWWFFSGLLIEAVYPYLLKHSDLVLVQHEGQKNILLKKNIYPLVFLNLIDMSKMQEVPVLLSKDFTYVGWLDKRKGIADFFRLVEKAPMHTFKVIGSPRDKTGHVYYEKLKKYPNVSLLGELSHSRTLNEIADSKALISTSPMEGFPNVFIEAWAFGIPVFSLNVDPGSVIEKEKLGVIANGDLNVILDAMNKFQNNNEFVDNARRYIEYNHALNPKKIHEINKIFTKLKNGQIRNI